MNLEIPRTTDEIIQREIECGLRLGPFHRRWLLERAPEKIQRALQLSRERPWFFNMPRQGFQALDLNDPNTADFTARNNSASELNILGDSANGTTPQAMIDQYCTIPPNDARAGKVYKIVFGGVHSTTGTPTIIWTPRWGNSPTVATNVSLGVSQTLTTGSGVSAQPWFGEFVFIVRTAPPGATLGTGKGHGYITMGTATTTAMVGTMGKTAATIDTTGQGTAKAGLTMNITWGTASASNTLTTETFAVMSLN